MAITYTDQFFIIDPYSPPPTGTMMTVHDYDLIDQNEDGDIDRFNNDSVDGSDVRSSYYGDTVTVNVSGIGNVTYVGVTFYLADGREVFTPTDGQVLQSGTLVTTSWVSGQAPLDVGDLGPVCFTRGTMIETTRGARAIEDLQEGDMVLTRDNGPQPIMKISRSRHIAQGVNAPVLIPEGALGNDADLLVSQQHRMLITGWRAELFLGCEEMLVAAKHLADGKVIRVVEGREVEYFHLLFSRHEIVTAAGIPSESYYPGHATGDCDHDAEAEIARLFPDLDPSCVIDWTPARTVARGFEGQLLVA